MQAKRSMVEGANVDEAAIEDERSLEKNLH